MEYLIYIMLFITGTLLGSFCTLATYRIPLKKDITHERSFCPNCNHELGFFDLIPILSYVFLKGRCRYCKQKISPRYILLEIFAGLSVLLFAMSINFQIYDISSINYLLIGILYILTLILLGMIDKEHHQIQKGVFLFGDFVILSYISYLYIVEEANIYRYAIYFFIMQMLILINRLYYKRKKEENYTIGVLALICLVVIFSGTETFIFAAGLSVITTAIYTIFKKNIKQIPIAYFLCFYSIVCMILQNFLIG